jgi:hypothetical protein
MCLITSRAPSRLSIGAHSTPSPAQLLVISFLSQFLPIRAAFLSYFSENSGQTALGFCIFLAKDTISLEVKTAGFICILGNFWMYVRSSCDSFMAQRRLSFILDMYFQRNIVSVYRWPSHAN